jgi:O-antigen/teichoic acid export membrane protein
MSGNKTILKNTILLYIRQIFVLLVALYTSRLTLQALGVTDFGVYSAVGGITALLGVITSSLSSGTQRFLTFELGKGNYEGLLKVYNNSHYVYATLSVLLLIVGETLGTWFLFHKMSIPQERLMTAFYVFQFTLASSVLSLTNSPNSAAVIAHEDMGIYAVFSIVDVTQKVASVALLFVLPGDRLLLYAGFLFFIQCVGRAINEIWCHRRYEECRYVWCFDGKVLRAMLGVSGWSGLSNISISVFIQGVNLLLNVFFGPLMNAAYGVAMQAYSGIRSFTSSFQLASNPQIVKLYSVGDKPNMCRLVLSVCRMSFYLIFCLSLPFLINAHFVLSLWLGAVPAHTEAFFRLLLIYAYIDVLAYPLDIAAQATGQLRRYSSFVSLAVLSILPIAYVCYTLGAMAESIYIVAIMVSWLSLFIRISCLKRLIGIRWKSFLHDVILRFVGVVALSLILPLLLHGMMSDTWTGVIVSFVVSVASAALSIYFVGLEPREKAFMWTYFRNVWYRMCK